MILHTDCEVQVHAMCSYVRLMLSCEFEKVYTVMYALCHQLSCVIVMYILHAFIVKIITIKGSRWLMVKQLPPHKDWFNNMFNSELPKS